MEYGQLFLVLTALVDYSTPSHLLGPLIDDSGSRPDSSTCARQLYSNVMVRYGDVWDPFLQEDLLNSRNDQWKWPICIAMYINIMAKSVIYMHFII